MNLSLAEMDAGTVLVVDDRGVPLVVSTAVQRLSVQSELDVVDVCDGLVQLVGGDVELYEEKTALCGQRVS